MRFTRRGRSADCCMYEEDYVQVLLYIIILRLVTYVYNLYTRTHTNAYRYVFYGWRV